MNTFGLILGSSGVGKGTRMNQFIKFLETKFTPEHILKNDLKGNEYHLGLTFKELDLTFLGKYVQNKKTGNTTWVSMDGLWSRFGGTEPTVAYIKTLPGNILAEGYSNMDTFRVRPVHMKEGFNRFFYQVYYYGLENKEEYYNRIITRNGKPPKGDTAFEKEKAIMYFPTKIRKELEEVPGDNYESENLFDAPITNIGYNYLIFLGEDSLAQEFLKWSETNSMLYEFKSKDISDEEW